VRSVHGAVAEFMPLGRKPVSVDDGLGGRRSRWTTVSVDDGLGGRTAMAHVCRLPRCTMSGRASRTADRATAKGDEVAFYRDRCWGRGRSLRIALRGALESRGVYGVCGFCGFYFPFRQM